MIEFRTSSSNISFNPPGNAPLLMHINKSFIQFSIVYSESLTPPSGHSGSGWGSGLSGLSGPSPPPLPEFPLGKFGDKFPTEFPGNVGIVGIRCDAADCVTPARFSCVTLYAARPVALTAIASYPNAHIPKTINDAPNFFSMPGMKTPP